MFFHRSKLNITDTRILRLFRLRCQVLLLATLCTASACSDTSPEVCSPWSDCTAVFAFDKELIGDEETTQLQMRLKTTRDATVPVFREVLCNLGLGRSSSNLDIETRGRLHCSDLRAMSKDGEEENITGKVRTKFKYSSLTTHRITAEKGLALNWVGRMNKLEQGSWALLFSDDVYITFLPPTILRVRFDIGQSAVSRLVEPNSEGLSFYGYFEVDEVILKDRTVLSIRAIDLAAETSVN